MGLGVTLFERSMLMEKYKISVVVPVYNLQNQLEHCVNSILTQTYGNLEIILVDDGSTDNSPAIIDKLASEDERIIAVHKENGGVTSARLEGVKRASGEYIGFVDGDDEIESDMYELLIGNALKFDADISHCGYQMMFPSGRKLLYYNTGRLVEQDRQKGLKDLIEGSFVEPGLCNKLFRKNLFHSLLNTELMDRSIKFNEDFLMNFYLFSASNMAVFEDICKYHYLVHEGSAAKSSLTEHKLKDPLKVTWVAYKQTEQMPIVHDAALGRLANQLVDYAVYQLKGQPDFVKPYRKKVRRDLRYMLPIILKNKKLGKKVKMKALWAAVAPTSYGCVHKLYLRKTGLDRIYALD